MKAVQALVIFGLLAACSQAVAGRFWSEDKVTNSAIIAANTLLVVDWAQTRYISNHPEEFSEAAFAENFIGAHPATKEVDRYFATSIIAINTMGFLLPEKATTFGFIWNPKKILYFGMSAVEVPVIRHNYQAGVKLDF